MADCNYSKINDYDWLRFRAETIQRLRDLIDAGDLEGSKALLDQMLDREAARERFLAIKQTQKLLLEAPAGSPEERELLAKHEALWESQL